MPAYVTAEIKTDITKVYGEYRKPAPAAVAAFGGRFVVPGGGLIILESDPEPDKIVRARYKSTEQVVTQERITAN